MFKEKIDKELLASEWLLLEESGWKPERDVVVNLSTTNHLLVSVEFEFYGVGTIERSAILDTGSQVCFLNRQILVKFAPTLLQGLMPCPVRFTGISGNAFAIDGVIQLDCKVAGRVVNQHFVVASISQDVLLGLDFMTKHGINWDYMRGRVKYDDHILLSVSPQTCELQQGLDLPPKSLVCVEVKCSSDNHFSGLVCLQRSSGDNLPVDIIVSDLLSTAENGLCCIEVGNCGDEPVFLEKGCIVGEWADSTPDEICRIIPYDELPIEESRQSPAIVCFNTIEVETENMTEEEMQKLF